MMIWKLRLQTLDLDDLGPVIGAPPATGEGEVTSPAQRRLAERQTRDEEVLPQATLMRDRLRAVDARLDYKAEAFTTTGIPFDDLTLQLRLEDGVMHLEPLSMHFGDGAINLRVTIDATTYPAAGDVRVEVARVNLKRLLAPFDAANDALGIIGGTGDFRFTGNSVAASLGSLEGDIRLLMEQGRLDTVLVEAAGIDLTDIVSDELVARSALAVLGAIASPPAALLPLVEWWSRVPPVARAAVGKWSLPADDRASWCAAGRQPRG